MKRVKIAISGAAGQIGYALIFRIAAGEAFGPNTEIELNLLELEQALPSLEGIRMELEDCAFPLLRNVNVTSDVNVAMKDVNWAVLVGSVPRKEGMERSDLLKINGKIFTTQGRAISVHAAPDVRVFVVGNPCNTNCLVAMHNAKDVPHDRFYAMTLLDEFRARMQLSIKAQVPVHAISNLCIWGNHSSTQYPDFYNAKINNQKVTEVITDTNWLQNDFIPMIQKRGAAVIKARGASSAASAANAALMSLHNLVHETKENEIFSIGKASRGEYDIPEGLIFSMPCRTKNQQLEVVKGWQHNEFGKQKIAETMNELLKEKEAVKELGLI